MGPAELLSFYDELQHIAGVKEAVSLMSPKEILLMVARIARGDRIHPNDMQRYFESRTKMGLPRSFTPMEKEVAQLHVSGEDMFPPYGASAKKRLDDVLAKPDPIHEVHQLEQQHAAAMRGQDHARYRFEERLRAPHGLISPDEVLDALGKPDAPSRQNWDRAERLVGDLRKDERVARRMYELPDTSSNAQDPLGKWRFNFQGVKNPETGVAVPLTGIIAKHRDREGLYGAKWSPRTTLGPGMSAPTEGDFSDLRRRVTVPGGGGARR